MPWVPDSHITEETMICPQDVVCTEPHLPPQPYHAPRPPVPAPWTPSQEEVVRHFLQSRRHQSHHYILLYPISSRLLQVCVYVSCHRQLWSLGALCESCDDTIYRQGVVGGEVTSDAVPLLLPHRQLEADGIWTKVMDGIHRIPQWRPIEHHYSAVVSARHVHSDNAVPGRPKGVNSSR